MANEITVKVSLSYAKAGQTVITRSNPTASGDVLTQKTAEFRYVNRVQNISAAGEALDIPSDITSPGISWFKNLGATTIQFKDLTGGATVASVEAGEWAIFRVAASTLWAIADTSASDLEFFIIDD